jgi:hypothetical protein
LRRRDGALDTFGRDDEPLHDARSSGASVEQIDVFVSRGDVRWDAPRRLRAALPRELPLSAMGLVLNHTCTRAMVIAVPTELASRGAKHVQNRIAGDSWERH